MGALEPARLYYSHQAHSHHHIGLPLIIASIVSGSRMGHGENHAVSALVNKRDEIAGMINRTE